MSYNLRKFNNNIIFLFISFVFFSTSLIANDEVELSLNAESRHEKIGALVQRLIERAHYNHTKVNDELSSEVLRSVSEWPKPTVNFTSLPSLLKENIFFPVYEAGFLKFI